MRNFLFALMALALVACDPETTEVEDAGIDAPCAIEPEAEGCVDAGEPVEDSAVGCDPDTETCGGDVGEPAEPDTK